MRPSLVGDHLSYATANPKHQNYSSQSLTLGAPRKLLPPVKNQDRFLGVTVNEFPFF